MNTIKSKTVQNNKTALGGGSGFTIIEVVLVLAIAGLIFLMVFLALPALQRSQRDTARKNDVGIVVAGIQSYMGNNKEKLPDSDQANGTYFPTAAGASGGWDKSNFKSYVDTLSSNISVIAFAGITANYGNYNFATVYNSGGYHDTAPKEQDTIIVFPGRKCAADANTSGAFDPGSGNSAAVMAHLEAGGYYCVDV
jgi:type II secretory pathway pseudopilin PulG